MPKAKIGGSNILEVRVTDLAGLVPADGVTAVSLNVTATNPDADGFITVFACGAIEEVSSLNYSAGETVANAVIAPVSDERERSVSTATYRRTSSSTSTVGSAAVSGRLNKRRRHSGAGGVVAAVDVDDLARRRREPVTEQDDARLGDRRRVGDVPAEWGTIVPDVLELLEPGNALGGHGLHRARGHQVRANSSCPRAPPRDSG